MPLNIHKEHFQDLVDKNKHIRRTLTQSSKIKIQGDWCVIESVPWDEDILYCYNEQTKAQYTVPFGAITLNKLETIPK